MPHSVAGTRVANGSADTAGCCFNGLPSFARGKSNIYLRAHTDLCGECGYMLPTAKVTNASGRKMNLVVEDRDIAVEKLAS